MSPDVQCSQKEYTTAHRVTHFIIGLHNFSSGYVIFLTRLQIPRVPIWNTRLHLYRRGPAWTDYLPFQLCQLIVYYTPNGITICIFFLLTRPSKTGKESFLRQILPSDLRFDTYEWNQTKIWMIFQLKSWGVLIWKVGVV